MAILDKRRRTIRLLQPALQLKLPLYLVVASIIFMGTVAAVGYSGLMRPAGFALAEVPPSLAETIGLILRDFALLLAAATIGFVLYVVTLSMVYVKRLVGPTIALRRQVESLKNGDYQARVRLRQGDAFGELADDLNELAGLLESERKRR